MENIAESLRVIEAIKREVERCMQIKRSDSITLKDFEGITEEISTLIKTDYFETRYP